jgi:hypothetical protein
VKKTLPHVQKQIEKLLKKEDKKLAETIRMFMDLHYKIMKRCLLDGCRYEPSEPSRATQKCMYCDTPRPAGTWYVSEGGSLDDLTKVSDLTKVPKKP